MAEEILISTRLGDMTVSRDRVIVFPRGLIGFEDRTEFVLLQIREESPFLILQCITDPRLGLLVTDPYTFLEGYDVRISESEQKILQTVNPKQIAVLVTVSIPAGKPERTTLNLSGPIVVNSATKIGIQIPQIDTGFPSNYLLPAEPRQADGGAQPTTPAREVSVQPSNRKSDS